MYPTLPFGGFSYVVYLLLGGFMIVSGFILRLLGRRRG